MHEWAAVYLCGQLGVSRLACVRGAAPLVKVRPEGEGLEAVAHQLNVFGGQERVAGKPNPELPAMEAVNRAFLKRCLFALLSGVSSSLSSRPYRQ